MSSYVNKPTSLVERKKQQWAREREELAGLSAPWSFLNSSSSNLSSGHVTKLVSTTANTTDVQYARRESNASRRQSLPPIYKKQSNSYAPNERYDKELGGETSGYGSDNPNNTPEYFQNTSFNQNLGYESSSSARDDRAKWGERGVGIGKFWDPQDVKYCHKMDDTPGWVKRGLQEGTELLISNTSPAESPEQDYGERPYTSSSISQTRTYIRGQNNPVDPVELMQRELKRQAAQAHQEAIKQQLEEREQKRREERERRIKEEYEEELRIAREQEIERKRREREHQLLLEKQEIDRKRKEALREAIKLAEKEAQDQKLKQKLLRQANVNINENVVEKEKISPRSLISNNVGNYNTSNNNNNNNIDDEGKNNNDKIYNANNNDVTPPVDNEKSNNSQLIINHNNTNNNYNNNSNLSKNENKKDNLNRVECSTSLEFSNLQSPRQQEAPLSKPKINNAENSSRSIQTPLDGYTNIPFAILMPTFNAGLNPSVPIVVPMQVNNNDPINTPRTENKVLTPTQYRNRRVCDSSTQTDFKIHNKSESDQSRELKYIKEKLNNLELADEAKNRTENKSRSGDKVREHSGDKPKWGANRPPTRYMKQSEKDPFYNRKKSRQKLKQIKMFDDKNNNYSPHSSDESQMASPRSYRKKGYIEKRRTRALWQKHGPGFARNLQVYQTEIVPLESDSNQIYYKKSNCKKCCCECRSNKHKYTEQVKVVDILKIEHSPREEVQRKNSFLPECPNSSIDGDVLEKLNSLHNGLMLKQEQWQQHSPSTPSLSSTSRVTETMAKVDDFLGKKKEVAPILDLSKSTAKSPEEFRKLLDRVPDFKVKSEKVRGEDIKIRDKHFKFKTSKKDYKAMKETFLYQNPIPTEMRSIKFKDLVAISIDWKMLTNLRPKIKNDEEFFSRLVELGKAELKTAASDKRALTMDSQIRKTKNKAGVIEMRPVACKDCGEDFCTGKACMKFSYDYFVRIPEAAVASPSKAIAAESSKTAKKKKKIKRKSRNKSKTKGKKRNKSKSPKKPVTNKTK